MTEGCCYNEETGEYYEFVSISPTKEMCANCQQKREVEYDKF